MRKNILLATTTLVAAFTLAATAQAGGRTQLQDLQAQIQALQAQVNALQAQQADEARAEQDAAVQEQSRLLKVEKGGWWANTSVSGRMYYDLSYIDNQHTNGAITSKDNQNGVSFDIKRFYVGIDHTFDSVYSANVTTDFQYSSNISSTELFLKKAYLQAKYDDAFTVRAGAADMPWIPFVEDIYGYRYIDKTLIDRTNFGTSSDWGVHILGKLFDGMLNYQVSVVDGNGYKKPATGTANRTDTMDVEGRVNLNVSDFTVAVGGYFGQLGTANNTHVFNDAERFDALAAYHHDGIRVGVEYFSTNDWFDVNTVPVAGSPPDPTSKANGISAFASYQFSPEWGVFGRYDYVKPYDTYQNTTTAAGEAKVESYKNNYYNVGISYSPTKIVDFALVYKHETGDDGCFSDGNGLIGSPSCTLSTGAGFGSGQSGKYDEIGLYGQFRW